MKILVVEDDTMIREGLSEFLSESGYSIIQAKDGKEALEKFNTDIHLVILDIQIPYINGLDVLIDEPFIEPTGTTAISLP